MKEQFLDQLAIHHYIMFFPNLLTLDVQIAVWQYSDIKKCLVLTCMSILEYS